MILATAVSFDFGQYASARQLFLLGLLAGRESDGAGVRALAACGLTPQKIHTDNWAGGLGLTELASTGTRAFTPNAGTMLHTVDYFDYADKQDANQYRRCIDSTTAPSG